MSIDMMTLFAKLPDSRSCVQLNAWYSRAKSETTLPSFCPGFGLIAKCRRGRPRGLCARMLTVCPFEENRLGRLDCFPHEYGMSSTRIPLDGSSNPLVSLAITCIQAILHVLQRVRDLIAWLTITLPR